ncbi:MAG: Rap1a/Tai family immunity protein [Candidatus Puniceispirillum sp.]
MTRGRSRFWIFTTVRHPQKSFYKQAGNHDETPHRIWVCFVYIAGAVDAFTTIDLMGEKTSGTKRQFCLPDGVSPDQLKTTTMQWLARPEANLDLAATLLVWRVIKDAYGCE